MNFDRNTVIGYLILAVLFFALFYSINQNQLADNKTKARERFIADSIANANRPKVDPTVLRADTLRADRLNRLATAGYFSTAVSGEPEVITLSNALMTVSFTTKGGQVAEVKLSGFDQHKDTANVVMAKGLYNQLSYEIKTGSNSTAQTADLFFTPAAVTTAPDGSQTLRMSIGSTDSTQPVNLTHVYTIHPDSYLIDFSIEVKGAEQLLTQGLLSLQWQYEAFKQESDVAYEKQNTQVGFEEDGEFDYFTIGNRSELQFPTSVSWLGFRQRFFFAALAAKTGFKEGRVSWTLPNDSLGVVIRSASSFKLQLAATGETRADLNLYYGPSDYQILKNTPYGFDRVVNLGQGVYAFVRPINKYIIVPIFDFMRQLSGASLGLAIALLTLFIRLVTSPLTYSSYLSGAKMKALRPEIAKLKEKFGDDQQTISMEQMKLFREAGVNPLGGCIPALLQIPIFFALFSFFNSEISLRGAAFLWSGDLSAYDAPIQFGFHIPLFGDHLSLFNLLATLTSLLISVYSMSMSPDQSNPLMKYMPYIFPFFMLFFFNNLPSALTWYYTVSNLITLAMQYVIQNYIIDHDKILAKIQENRKKPKTKSKWQAKLEELQEQQKKLKERK
jgi:YidC/Oxa1 family membrane protein insertase